MITTKPPPSIKLIIFDLDYTLWDTTNVIESAEAACHTWMKENAPKATELYQHPKQLHILERALWQKYPILKYDVTQSRISTLQAAFSLAGYNLAESIEFTKEAYKVFYDTRNIMQLYPNTKAVLTELQKDYTLATITNGNANLKRQGIEHFFKVNLSAGMHGRPKPHPDMFELTLACCNCRADQAIYVGDQPLDDVVGAKSAGLKAVWINQKRRAFPSTAKYLGYKPDITINSIDKLEKALIKTTST